jgi:hypothetical protein
MLITTPEKHYRGRPRPYVPQPEDVQAWKKKHRANWTMTAKHFGLSIATVKTYCTTFYCVG